MTYVKVNVNKPGANAGTGIKPKAAITFIDVEDISSFPSRDENGVLIESPIVLNSGAYSITVYATQDSIELASNSDGDTDNEGFTPSLKFKHPGNKQEIREFKAGWLGRQCIVLVDYCNGEAMDLIGSPCNPVKLAMSYTGNKDANSNEFTCTQMMRGLDIAMYSGNAPASEPAAVVSAGATTIPLAGAGSYQLTGDATSASITAASGASDGLVFTLLGVTSGTAPSIAASTTFLLKSGVTWNATTGKQITFKAFKSGASSYVYIEQSRV